MIKCQLPAGWDEERVKQVVAHYETQSEAESVAEDEPDTTDYLLSTEANRQHLLEEMKDLDNHGD